MKCSLPGFSVHGILQARILECARKAVKVIVDSAVAVEPAPMKVIGDESAE